MNIRKLISLLLAALLLLGCLPALGEEATGEEAPITFDVAAYLGAISDLDLTPYYGKVIMLHFYSATDEVCAAMLPALKLIYDDFSKDDVEIVLIQLCDGEGQEELDALKEQLGLEEMNHYADVDASLSHTLGVFDVPNTLILNQEGNPVSGYSGRMGYTVMAELLVSLGAEQLQNSYQPATAAPAE